jgi:glycosyltransferase involved in cell wall biosynthesis
MPDPRQPLFSVVISTYNREASVQRCVASCLSQECDDFEVVVVDDGSSDDTVAALERIGDSRLRVVVHGTNRGMLPARHTGVVKARGTWLIVLDSDWELVPGALGRLAEIIKGLPAKRKVLWFRVLWDDGRISPAFVPEGPVDYRRKLAWVEQERGSDAGRCIHRTVFERTPFFADRFGRMEWLYELDLAKADTALYLADVLAKQHFDAPHSLLRAADPHELYPRLLREAPDMLWMTQTALERHGEALRELSPTQHRELVRLASRYSFLLGKRRQGLRYAWQGVRLRDTDATLWLGVVLGVIGPQALVYGIAARRRLDQRHRHASSRPIG